MVDVGLRRSIRRVQQRRTGQLCTTLARDAPARHPLQRARRRSTEAQLERQRDVYGRVPGLSPWRVRL